MNFPSTSTLELPYVSILRVDGCRIDLSPIIQSNVVELSRFTSAPVSAFSRTVGQGPSAGFLTFLYVDTYRKLDQMFILVYAIDLYCVCLCINRFSKFIKVNG